MSADLGLPSIDVDRARAYVLAHGGSWHIARLAGIFGAPGPDREVAREFEELQNPDGGFPLLQKAGNPSSIDATCAVLAQLKEMPPLAGSPMASRAVAFLRRTQATDGSWSESEAVAAIGAALPDADLPESKGYLTAIATYTLMTLEPGHVDPIARGQSWLRVDLGREISATGIYSRTLGLAAAIWYKVLGPTSQEAAWAAHVLGQRSLDAGDLAWTLSIALEVGTGGRFLVGILQGLHGLAAMQREDGAWPSAAGLELDATLTALKVFRGYGLL